MIQPLLFHKACHYLSSPGFLRPSSANRNGQRPTMLTICCYLLTFATLLIVPHAQAGESSWSRTQQPYVIDDKTYYPIPSSEGFNQQGQASWYGPPFHGRKTSNGEVYDMHSMTAAHKTLPMDTVLMVKNLENGRNTLVRVNDRGPFVGERIIDLSYKAARDLGVVGNGTATVEIVALAEGKVIDQGEAPVLSHKDFSVGEFYVQIGSFAQKFNAAKLQKRFADAGHPTIIHESFNPNDILYRVHVYVGETWESAKRAQRALLERGYRGAFVVAR
jgi:rare lipoprotein A